jgi:hypothetical protein
MSITFLVSFERSCKALKGLQVRRGYQSGRSEIYAGTNVLGISRGRGGCGGFLAKEILRFQCLECEEGKRKAGVHACESRDPRTRGASEGLAVEQLVVLREGRRRVARIDVLGEKKDREASLANARKSQRPHPSVLRVRHPESSSRFISAPPAIPKQEKSQKSHPQKPRAGHANSSRSLRPATRHVSLFCRLWTVGCQLAAICV